MLSNISLVPKLHLLGVFGCFVVFKVHECVLYLVFTLITPPAWSVAPTSIDLQFLGLLHQFWDPVSGLTNKHSCGQGHASLTCCTKGCTHQLMENQTSYCYSRLLKKSPNRSNIRFYSWKGMRNQLNANALGHSGSYNTKDLTLLS